MKHWLISACTFIVLTNVSYAQEPIVELKQNAEQALGASKNAHLREHAYVLLDSVWLRPQVYVCWENPTQQFEKEMNWVQREVEETWAQESRLEFSGWQKCANENKGVRILIDDSGPHTKGLGRQLDALKNGMVLNFTFKNWSSACQATREYCIKAVAGHEFGHAIGLAHEQNRPDKPGECREPPQGGNGNVMLTPYDKNSIMNYCNSKWNNDARLSPLDVDAVRQLYGIPAPKTNAAPQLSVQMQQDLVVKQLESSANPHLREHAYIVVSSLWSKPQIYVCWENPSTQYQRDMSLVQRQIVDTWERESSLKFTGWQKCAAQNRGIRILIDDSGPHTKGLGQDLDGKRNGMVLNFTFRNWSQGCQASRDYCIRTIAGHEFGHAIGFAHEQNRPDAPGECRLQAQGGNGDALLTPYDEHSIMNYCNPQWNNEGKLSELDIKAVRELYGVSVAVR